VLECLLALTVAGTSCSGKGDLLNFDFAVTNRQGIAALDKTVKVQNKEKTLEGIFVYQVKGRNESYLSIAVDPTGKHLPEMNQTKYFFVKKGVKKSGLVAELGMILLGVTAFGTAYKDAKNQEEHFMGEDENVNKYCVSLEQMVNTNITVPMGLIGIASHEIKFATLTPLKWLFEKYVVSTVGMHNGYEVWVPKVSVNLCGSDYEGVVCKIKNEESAKGLFMHQPVPAWEVKGNCDISNYGSIEFSNNDDKTQGDIPSNPCEGSKIYSNGTCVARPCDGSTEVCDVSEECKPACVSTGFRESYLEISCNSSTTYSVCSDGSSRCIPVCLER
jgi:hypothetical protein